MRLKSIRLHTNSHDTGTHGMYATWILVNDNIGDIYIYIYIYNKLQIQK